MFDSTRESFASSFDVKVALVVVSWLINTLFLFMQTLETTESNSDTTDQMITLLDLCI